MSQPLSDAEQALYFVEQDLAVAAFHDAEAEAARPIDPRAFRYEPARSIYAACLSLHEEGHPVVQSLVEAKINGQIDQVGGLDTLRELLSRDVASEADLIAARIMIREAADDRNAQQAGTDIRQTFNRTDIGIIEALTIAREIASDALEIQRPQAQRFELVSAAAMEDREPPDPFIDGMIDQGAFVGLAGPPGGGKSFLALDWALSAATGIPWQGRNVQHGPTVYVSAEGAGGLGPRIAAWREATAQQPIKNAYFITVPVSLMEQGDVQQLTAAIKKLKIRPVLIVFDTLARCMVGGDENKQQDMGRLVHGVDAIRNEFGCVCLVVHHMNAGAERERGSTAFRAACDTLMWLKSDQDDILTLSCEKQKEHAPFDKLRLKLTPVGSSVTVRLTHDVIPNDTFVRPSYRKVLEGITAAALSDGLSSSQWEQVCDVDRATFFRARKYLHQHGFVDCPDLGKRGAKYFPTDKGFTALGITVS